MAKLFREQYTGPGPYGTVNTWYKATDIVLLDNSGKTPVRIDKEMCQISAYSQATMPTVVGCVVHLTDETGASFTGSIVNGTTTDAGLETLLNQWKECIFMTDFQLLGIGYDETNIFVSNMEADTKRILMPGQKLLVTILAQPLGAESGKYTNAFVDNIVWYSPAAQ